MIKIPKCPKVFLSLASVRGKSHLDSQAQDLQVEEVIMQNITRMVKKEVFYRVVYSISEDHHYLGFSTQLQKIIKCPIHTHAIGIQAHCIWSKYSTLHYFWSQLNKIKTKEIPVCMSEAHLYLKYNPMSAFTWHL